MPRRPQRFAVALVALALAFAPALAEAAAGGGKSTGSRGSRTQQAPAPTQTAPGTAKPIERTQTPAQPSRPAATAPAAGQAQPSFFQRNPMMAGLLGGLVGAGLLGMLLGSGFNLGDLGMSGMFGLLLQIAMIGGLVWLAFRLYRRFAPRPAYAGASPDALARTAEPIDVRTPAAGGFAPRGTDAVAIGPADFDAFERNLASIQAAWTKGDLAALHRLVTPEMHGYFADELAANTARGVENRVDDVKLEQGDLAEAWREGDGEYATVALRWSARDATVAKADGRVVEGRADARSETTEIWTFVRAPGGDWRLSAIQQA